MISEGERLSLHRQRRVRTVYSGDVELQDETANKASKGKILGWSGLSLTTTNYAKTQREKEGERSD